MRIACCFVIQELDPAPASLPQTNDDLRTPVTIDVPHSRVSGAIRCIIGGPTHLQPRPVIVIARRTLNHLDPSPTATSQSEHDLGFAVSVEIPDRRMRRPIRSVVGRPRDLPPCQMLETSRSVAKNLDPTLASRAKPGNDLRPSIAVDIPNGREDLAVGRVVFVPAHLDPL